MSHPFGDLLTQHLHRKHGLSQSKLAAGILQSPSIITDMSQGKRLNGPQARERVTAIINWLQQQRALEILDEANALLNAAGMSPLQERDTAEAILIQKLSAQASANQRPLADAPSTLARSSYTPPRHNLPPQLTPFIGRSEQIAQLVQQFQTRRLLTLTGAGGVGKTRLALEVANQLCAEFADGIWLIDLAPLTNPASALQRILDHFGLPEQPDRPRLAMVTAYLSTKQLLLILDNCEHLIDACAELAEAILQHCPQVSLLATSREALNISAELPWRVPSLTRPLANQHWQGAATPTQSSLAPEDLLRFEAATLFVERAHRHKPDFVLSADNAPAVAHICSRLDGIPLALEMAAARVNVFTVEELARRLDGAFDRRFQLLTSGSRTAPQRQQTLRATLEWSYELLTPAEQDLLVRLSVFSGGWTAAASEEVTGSTLDLLAQLVNKSLVIADQQAGQTRYRLLETVRQFAVERGMIEEQAYRQAQTQHSRYYLTLLGEQEQPLESPQQRAAIDIIRADFENISVAWRWAVQAREFTLLAPAIHTVFLYCEVRGNYREGILLLSDVLARLTDAATTSQPHLQPLLAQVLVRLGACEVVVDQHKLGIDHLQQGLGYDADQQERAFALTYIGHSAIQRGEVASIPAMRQESLTLCQQSNDRSGAARALFLLDNGIHGFAEAIERCEESLALWREVGRPDRIAEVSGLLAWHKCCQGDYEQANAYWQENLEICRVLGMQHALAWTLDCLGWSAWCQNDLTTAQKHLEAALAIYRTIGMPSGIAMCLAEMALVLRSNGDVAQAVQVARQAVVLVRDADNHQFMLVLSLNYYGAALIGAEDAIAARQVLTEACQRAWKAQYHFFLMNTFYYFAELLVLESSALNLPLALEHKALAVTLLTCVRIYPATWQIYRDKAAQLQAEIEDALPTETLAAAIARGQRYSLEEMVSVLLGTVDRR